MLLPSLDPRRFQKLNFKTRFGLYFPIICGVLFIYTDFFFPLPHHAVSKRKKERSRRRCVGLGDGAEVLAVTEGRLWQGPVPSREVCALLAS